VNLPQETIVDPSYQQFINLFHLDRAHIPQEEILVVPYEQLDSKIDQFVKLRDLKFKTHPHPQMLRSHSEIFRMQDDDLHDYFKKVWDFKNGIYKQTDANELAEDVEEYGTKGPQAVTDLTGKLITCLKEQNLTK
jgi:hypothetical protein